MKQVRTHYDNLKVARNAPLEVIRAAYRTLSQKHHPDRNGGSPESQRVMKIINESYAVLSDTEARKKHDDWIRQQESNDTYNEQPATNKKEIEFPPPVSGQIRFNELDEDTQRRIKERASGVNKDQYAVKLDGVISNYVWIILLSGWFYYIYTDAIYYRWSSETTYWHFGFTAGVWFTLSKNISWVYSWHSKPLKSWLVVTPLYVMRFRLDHIHYWSIWTISDIKATHNYQNGSYQDTSLSIMLDGKNEIFSISSGNAYRIILNKLREYDQKFRMAVGSNDVAYIVNNDDFINVVNKTDVPKKTKNTSSIVIYILLALLAFGFFGVVYDVNQDRPFKPEYSKARTPYNSNPQGRPNYVRPATAPNGASWPTHASYVSKYPKLNTMGLSSVTIDNTQNDSDVFVKLFSLDGAQAYPVRQFYIPAFRSFTLKKITAGNYDIRYRDLTNGELSRSEVFNLKQIRTYDGVQYSNITMTLYKVQNGNMQTYGLSEAEF